MAQIGCVQRGWRGALWGGLLLCLAALAVAAATGQGQALLGRPPGRGAAGLSRGGASSGGVALATADGKVFVVRGGTLYRFDAATWELEARTVFAEQLDGPPGAPPGGVGGETPGGPGGGAGPAMTAPTTTGAHTVDGTAETVHGRTITASGGDQSGVWVKSGGTLTLSGVRVVTSGDTSSQESSSFYGLNAGILASDGTVTMTGGSVSTTGEGANGIFAVGKDARISIRDATIRATAGGGHAMMATLGGVIEATNVDMDTAGIHGAPIATDRGGGTLRVRGGTVTCSGQDSPGIYSTGEIAVTDARITAVGSEGAVIEGANSIVLENTALSGARKCGAMIYQSMSGDAQGARGVFTMAGGSFRAAVGPLFYVTNTTGIITLRGVDCRAESGVLVNASAGRWGIQGRNGGVAVLTADGQLLEGDLLCDGLSSIAVSLVNGSKLTGAIQTAALTLEGDSEWFVTADSALTTLVDPDGIEGMMIRNIRGNGHTVTYDPTLETNRALGSRTYALTDGGVLRPR